MSEEKIVEAPEAGAEGADDASIEATWTDLAEARKDLATAPLSDDKAKKAEALEAPKVEAPVEEPTASQAASDPWKDAPPELREAHETALAAERTRAENAETLAKRHSGRLSQLNQRLNDLQSKLEPEHKGESEEEAKTREERRAQIREEYPDSAGAILDELEAVEAEIREIKANAGQKAEADADNLIAEQESILTEAHADWRTEVKDNPKFVEWAVNQPEYVLATIRQNANQIISGADIADVISRFKADTKAKDPEQEKEEQRRQEQLDAGRDPSLKKPGMTATSSEDPDVLWNELAAKRKREAAR